MTAEVIQQFLASSLQYLGLPARKTVSADSSRSRLMIGLALAAGMATAALAQPNGLQSNSRVIAVTPGAASTEGAQRNIDTAPVAPAEPAARPTGKPKKHTSRSKGKRGKRAASR